jgi:hypothetical protein
MESQSDESGGAGKVTGMSRAVVRGPEESSSREDRRRELAEAANRAETDVAQTLGGRDRDPAPALP